MSTNENRLGRIESATSWMNWDFIIEKTKRDIEALRARERAKKHEFAPRRVVANRDYAAFIQTNSPNSNSWGMESVQVPVGTIFNLELVNGLVQYKVEAVGTEKERFEDMRLIQVNEYYEDTVERVSMDTFTDPLT